MIAVGAGPAGLSRCANHALPTPSGTALMIRWQSRATSRAMRRDPPNLRLGTSILADRS